MPPNTHCDLRLMKIPACEHILVFCSNTHTNLNIACGCQEQAEQEADVIIWDGGNNDSSFFKPGGPTPSLHLSKLGHSG
jgi:hypothetical protein